MLGSLIIYLKGMRAMMFQLSGFYYKTPENRACAPQMWTPRTLPFSPEVSQSGKARPTGFRV